MQIRALLFSERHYIGQFFYGLRQVGDRYTRYSGKLAPRLVGSWQLFCSGLFRQNMKCKHVRRRNLQFSRKIVTFGKVIRGVGKVGQHIFSCNVGLCSLFRSSVFFVC